MRCGCATWCKVTHPTPIMLHHLVSVVRIFPAKPSVWRTSSPVGVKRDDCTEVPRQLCIRSTHSATPSESPGVPKTLSSPYVRTLMGWTSSSTTRIGPSGLLAVCWTAFGRLKNATDEPATTNAATTRLAGTAQAVDSSVSTAANARERL